MKFIHAILLQNNLINCWQNSLLYRFWSFLHKRNSKIILNVVVDKTFQIIALIPQFVYLVFQNDQLVAWWLPYVLIVFLTPVAPHPVIVFDPVWRANIKYKSQIALTHHTAIRNWPVASKKYSRWAIWVNNGSNRIEPAVSVRPMKKFEITSTTWQSG